MKLLRNISILAAIILGGICIQSCEDDFGYGDETSSKSSSSSSREVTPETRRALIIFSDGFNSLSSYLSSDIEDLEEGYYPGQGRENNLLFLISSLPAKSGDYYTETSPVIVKMYQNYMGEKIMDTLKVFSAGTRLVDKTVMTEALSYIKDNYPAKSYGMIYSSHATGYLPGYYYSNTSSSSGIAIQSVQEKHLYVEPVLAPGELMTKSVGQETHSRFSYEMELSDFAEAIPMHLDYLLFDACFMGGVEVAYQLKDVADRIGFSQTEVLADGFDYTTVSSKLLEGDEADPESVCSDYFERYNEKSGISRSATISFVDCSKLEPLAEACTTLFEKYRSNISSVDYNKVQRYYRSEKHWFFDLEDILLKSGASSSDMKDFYSALDDCIIYKAATPEFMSEFTIDTYSGLSMFLPSAGNSYINNYYKSLKWNEATSLVK